MVFGKSDESFPAFIESFQIGQLKRTAQIVQISAEVKILLVLTIYDIYDGEK